jgi:hypothetical protein
MEMPTILYWTIPLGVALLGMVYFFWRVGRKYAGNFDSAHILFVEQRPRLEDAFFQAASVSGKPRGLRWKQCQWENLIEWMRDKNTGQIVAFVGVTILFEAIEGGDMEGLAAVGNLRNATAVFFYENEQWQTAGRAIFNLNPNEAVAHFSAGYERINGIDK